MERLQIRNAFINAAIEIGADKGIDAISRRELVNVSKVNQLYLYQEFKDIYDVQMQAFIYINRVFVSNVLKAVSVFDENFFTKENEEKFFNILWTDMKEKAQMFEFFLRYYYNFVFPKTYASEECRIDLEPLLKKITPFFKSGTNLVRVILHLLEDLVKYVVLIRNGEYPDNEKTDIEVYNCFYGVLSQHLLFSTFQQ